MLSEPVQDYLKAIYKLQEQGGVESTSALADIPARKKKTARMQIRDRARVVNFITAM